MKYEKQIKSPKWQKKRLEVLERDNFTCCFCGSTEKMLHVHHLYYEDGKKIWEYPTKALITLCEDCHKREHELGRGECDIYDAINLLRKCYGVTNFELRALFDHISFCSKDGIVSPIYEIAKDSIKDTGCDGDDNILQNIAKARERIIGHG